MFLNLRLHIVHSTGRSGVIVGTALPPSVLADMANEEFLGLDDLLRSGA